MSSLLGLSAPRLGGGGTRHMLHPKYKIRHWFKQPYGATKFKWHYEIPYERLDETSLHHFPEVSQVTGEPIDWYGGEPRSG